MLTLPRNSHVKRLFAGTISRMTAFYYGTGLFKKGDLVDTTSSSSSLLLSSLELSDTKVYEP